MNCPRCGDKELVERDRDGITVDGCLECRGIWLDRGELERLIQFSRKHDDDEDERERAHGHKEKTDKHRHDDDHERGHGLNQMFGHERERERSHDHDRDHDDHHAGGWRTADGRRQKPRRWLESLSDLFG